MIFYITAHTQQGDMECKMISSCYDELRKFLESSLPYVPYSVYSSLPKTYKTLIAQSNGGNDG